MKKQKNNKKSKKFLRKTKNRLIKNKSSKKTRAKKDYKKMRRRQNSKKKRTKMVMKGGALPFSELHPSNIFENIKHGISSSLSGGSFSDYPQHVPDNLPRTVSPSVLEQPYLDGTLNEQVAVAGDSPDVHFATPS